MRNKVGWVLLSVVVVLSLVSGLNAWQAQRQLNAGERLYKISEFALLGTLSRVYRQHHHFADSMTGYVTVDGIANLDLLRGQLAVYQDTLLVLSNELAEFDKALEVCADLKADYIMSGVEIPRLVDELQSYGVSTLLDIQRLLTGFQPGDFTRLGSMRGQLSRLEARITDVHGQVFERTEALSQKLDTVHESMHRWLVMTALSVGGCLLILCALLYYHVKEKRSDTVKLRESNIRLNHKIEEARRLTEELAHQVSHDPVSGMYNRSGFTERVEAILREGHGPHGLAMLNLDMFRVVNDTGGHAAGDEVLKEVAKLLTASVPETCTLGRLGGDEFVLFIEFCSFKEFEFLLNRLSSQLHRYRFRHDGHIYDINGSIGAIHLAEGEHELDTLFLHVDSACYMAKRSGGSRIAYSDGDNAPIQARREDRDWAERIMNALEHDSFKLFYQSIVNVDMHEGSRTHSWEILLRMIDEHGSIIPPGMFLGVAERFSLSPRIDRWVVRNTFDWLNENHHGALLFECISINLSGLSVGDSSFLEFLENQSARLEIPTHKVCFEITESAVVGPDAITFLQRLKDLGFQIALDDFGRGYSSFGYLEDLPVDYIKIDGTFVKDIEISESHEAFVRAINSVGKAMKKATVAEFVETQNAMKILAEIGVDYAQGYFIEKPRELPDNLERVNLRGVA